MHLYVQNCYIKRNSVRRKYQKYMWSSNETRIKSVTKHM